MTITQYVLETEQGDWSTPYMSAPEAIADARRYRSRGEAVNVLAVEYEYTDATLLWDPEEDD